LRKITHAGVGAPTGKRCDWDAHKLVLGGSDRRLASPDWGWAEIDGERPVRAVGGRLFAGTPGAEGLAREAGFAISAG
jgi:hypothetical protein